MQFSLKHSVCIALFVGAIGSSPARAQEKPSLEIGARYWFSTGRDKLDLRNVSGNADVSRLTWSGTTGNSGELFALGQFGNGLFAKGYLGTGSLSSGKLKDEDFIPFIVPYSSTDSQARGTISYASADLGYFFLNSKQFKLGGFVGYHYWLNKEDALGCAQTASNPFVCRPTIPTSLLVISEAYRWDGVRFGAATEYRSGQWRLQAEAAYVRAQAEMSDTHWLRLNTPGGFAGATPSDGQTNGVQLEAILSYQVSSNFSLGIGGRYWKYFDADGFTHFEKTAIPVGLFSPQHSALTSERYGVLLQGALKF